MNIDRENQVVKRLKLEERSTIDDDCSSTLTEPGICPQIIQDDAIINAAPISNLNDDCLREIFSYLSERQLIGIERVCKKWRAVALGFWLKKTTLKYKDITKITEDTEDTDQLNSVQIKKILKRCKSLTTLDLFHRDLFSLDNRLADAIVHSICRYCKNLKYLRVTGGLVSREGFKMLEATIAPQLELFKFNRCPALTDEILEKLLTIAPKLNNLCINGNSRLSGESLALSGRAYKELRISYCDEIKDKVLNEILDNSPTLEVLQCSGICTFNALNERPLREHLVKFQTSGSSFFKDASKFSLAFPNLRLLELNGDHSINNDILSQFYKWFPNLEALSLSGIGYKGRQGGLVALNDGIKKLIKLPKLKSINLNLLKWLTGDTLGYLAANTNGRIEVMKCASCPKLNNFQMIKFVSLCPNLKYLDVLGCKNLTEKFLDGVISLMMLRSSEKVLKIRIRHSNKCKLKNYYKSHPLLVIQEVGKNRTKPYRAEEDYMRYYMAELYRRR